jgi:hypothetical protein
LEQVSLNFLNALHTCLKEQRNADIVRTLPTKCTGREK